MSQLHFALRDKTVLITGAAGGIGRALALAFAEQGARLMLLDRAQAPLLELSEQLSGISEVRSAVCDLGDNGAVASVAADLHAGWGLLDVLVNNAGAEYPTPITDDGPQATAAWAHLLDNNVVSMVRLTRALLPLMPQGACVINQSSIWGKTGVAGFSAYSASKHAIVGLTRSLAMELGARGIRVNAVCPGWVRTEAAMRSLTSMAQEQGRAADDVEREILSRQTVQTMLAPADIAGVFLFLASDAAGSLNGQCLSASHGEVML